MLIRFFDEKARDLLLQIAQDPERNDMYCAQFVTMIEMIEILNVSEFTAAVIRGKIEAFDISAAEIVSNAMNRHHAGMDAGFF
jgi:hypothetical protein